jgi:hypothetical protein
LAGQNLSPVPNRTKRFILLAVLSILALIVGRHWGEKIGLVLGLPVLLGTYRRFRVSPGLLKQRWTIAFLDREPLTFKFKRYSRIEVKYAVQTSIGEILMFGFVALIFGWVLDTFFPWIGGTYQIWLTRSADEQVLAWQGNSQQHYEKNLAALVSATGLEVMVR